MAARSISFEGLAIRDFREAREWYAERSEETATRFVAAVDEAVEQIVQAPDTWPIAAGKFRRIALNKFPHSLVYYQPAEFDIRIVAIAHPSRRPGYWRRRK